MAWELCKVTVKKEMIKKLLTVSLNRITEERLNMLFPLDIVNLCNSFSWDIANAKVWISSKSNYIAVQRKSLPKSIEN